jgi:protein TonB
MTGLMLQETTDVTFSSSDEAVGPRSLEVSPWLDVSTSSTAPAAQRREVFVVILVSLLAHTAIAGYLATAERGAPAVYKPPSRVEVQFIRPPPPPPPPTPAQEPPPPPPVKQVAPKPKPLAEPPKPAASPPPLRQETREDIGIDAPAGEEGELPKGTGEIGTAPPAPPAPAAPPAPPAPAPVVGAREGANYQKNPRPPYPALAVRKGWEGQTVLRVQVLPNGRPGTISVQTSSGRDVLDEAAIEAVKGWTFVPATQGGLAITGWVNVPIVFRLQ